MGLAYRTWIGLVGMALVAACGSDRRNILPGDAGGGSGGTGEPDAGGGQTAADAGDGAAGGGGGAGAVGGSGGADPGAGDPVPCANSLDCASATGSRSICDPALGLCVQCTTRNDCPSNHECSDRRCEAYAPCSNSLDCPTGLVCATPRSRCVECVTNADCADDSACVDANCRVACNSDNQCTPLGLLCNFTGGYCAECLNDEGCEETEYCDGGRCRADACDPERTICTPAGVVGCSENGSSLLSAVPCGPRQSCVDTGTGGSCISWVCTAGETECLSSTELIECAADGFSVLSNTDCSSNGQYCVGGACSDQLCPAGELYCAQGEVRACAGDALTSTLYDACTASEYCDAADPSCKPQICAPRTATCNGNATTTCNSLGSGYTSVGTPCPDGQFCSGGSCGTSVLTDGFDDGTATDWTTYTVAPIYTTVSQQVVTTTAALGTTSSLSLSVQNLLAASEGGTSHGFVEAPIASAGFWIQPATTTNASFQLRQGGVAVMTVGVSNTGYFSVSGLDSATQYVTGTWYHVELRNIDWTGHTFDVYVNDVLVGQSNMSDMTATGVDEVRLGASPPVGLSASIYWDQITIG